MQRADRARHQGLRRDAQPGARPSVAERNKIKFSDLPAALEQQGVDYRELSRRDAQGNDAVRCCASATCYSRIYVSPREVDQCIAKRKAAPDADDEYNLAHILVAVPASATAQQVAERTARAAGRLRTRDEAARTSRSSRSPIPMPARRSKAARSAGARPSQLPSFVADIIPTMQAGRRHRDRSARRAACTSSSCSRCAARSQPALVSQVHARHILMKTNEVEDDETVRQKLDEDPRAHPGRARASRRSRRSPPTIPARRRTAATWAGPGPGTFVPEFEQQVDTLVGERDQRAVQVASSAGTSCSCSVAAPTTPPRT